MRSGPLIPVIAGLLTGVGMLLLNLYIPGMSLCISVFFVIGVISLFLSPLGSGRAFEGWTRASTTAIGSMNRDIRSRGSIRISDKVNALIYLLLSLFVYFTGLYFL